MSGDFRLQFRMRSWDEEDKLHVSIEQAGREIMHQVYDLEEQALREALIRRGWTPPDSSTAKAQ